MSTRTAGLLVGAALIAFAGAATVRAQSVLRLDGIPRVQPAAPVTFGTTQESFYTVGEWDFDPVASTETYADVGSGSLNTLRYATSMNAGFFAGPHVPDGAVLTTFTIDLCDSNTTDHHLQAALLSCGSVDGLCAEIGNLVATTSNVGTPCAAYTQDVSSLNFVVNNQTGRLAVEVLSSAADNTNAIAGATIGYKLQVSPAPATATFGDVPTNHPFFQYVEALAKSGITGGCGNGNYCPDAPLTRGQMAVFMAKGLGLQWP